MMPNPRRFVSWNIGHRVEYGLSPTEATEATALTGEPVAAALCLVQTGDLVPV